YVIATILNVFFLLGLIFISHLENLYILIPYVILMGINAIYLVVKVMNFKKNN
ncbi:membrane protein, partial [Staphylococcus aureus T20142]